MNRTRFSWFGTVGMTALLVGALLTALIGSVRASAQEASASPEMTDMGVCTGALGVGAMGDACVNVIHASPDAPAVDVYVDGSLALEGLAFGAASGWVALPAGVHQVQVTASGTMADEAVIDAELELQEGAAYEVAAVGLLADITAAVNQLNLSELDEDEARVRVVHASPDAPAVDIAVAGGDVLFAELSFPDASGTRTVPASTYDLEVRVAGTTDVALPLADVTLEPGMVYSIYAIGLVGDGSLTVLPIVSSTTGGDMATPAAA
jgi:hypothetical protein